jgi:hypothetical protein
LLETGTKDSGINWYHQGKAIKVPAWDFQTVVKSFLLDLILFGNRDNLVNGDTPFEKFIVENPTDCNKEYLASQHYSESYDLCIDDIDGPLKQFFILNKIYIDKSGKMAGIASSCKEPVLMSTPLLKSSVHEDPSSWCLLGFIPDLETTSSTKKQQEAQQKYEQGRNQHNYHSCLKEILKLVEQLMKQPGRTQ